MDATETSSNNNRQATNTGQPAITADLLEKVTEKVIAMLLMDLKIERERHQLTKRTAKQKGSWK